MAINVLASMDIMDTVYIRTSNYGHSVEVVSGLELSALYFGQRLNSAAMQPQQVTRHGSAR